MIDFSNLPAKDKIYYQDNTTAIYCADCREILPSIRGISAIVTDPPYNLTQLNIRNSYNPTPGLSSWDAVDEARKQARRGKNPKGFMGKEWDGTGISFQADTWRLIREACLPGAMLLSFGGDRTHHRMMVAIEDAGFEIRTCLYWCFASGFPKSLNIGKKLTTMLPASLRCVCADHLKDTTSDFPTDYQNDCGLYDGQPLGTKDSDLNSLPLQDDAPEHNRGGQNEDGLVEALIHILGHLENAHLSSEDYRSLCNLLSVEYPIADNTQCDMVRSKLHALLTAKHKTGIGISNNEHLVSDWVSSVAYSRPPIDSITRIYQQCKHCRKYYAGGWQGYGTGLKPAMEIICLAMKPLDGKTFAENCLKWGVGGLNIDATRIYANSSYRDDGNNESKDPSHKLSQLYDTLCILEPFSQVVRRDYRQVSSDIGYVRKVYKELGSQFYCPACRRLYDALLPIFQENDLDIFALLPSVLADIDHLRKEHNDSPCCLNTDHLSNLDAVHQLILSYHTSYNNYTTPDIKSQTQGRFPSNFIHDGSQEVMELFPESKSGAKKANQENYNHKGKEFVAALGASVNEYQTNQGSAARFFYCAKASKKERNMGLEDMEEKRLSRRSEEVLLRSNYVSTEQMFAIGDYIRSRMEIMGITLEYLNEHFNYVAGCNWWLSKNPNNLRVINPTDYKRLKEILQLDNRYDNLLLSNLYTEPKSIVDRPQSRAKNNHPTVKPLALMTYLCKLVKMPKYNLILDPFCGSGTTLLACKKLGIPCIGIEINPEYCEIAARRIERVQKEMV